MDRQPFPRNDPRAPQGNEGPHACDPAAPEACSGGATPKAPRGPQPIPEAPGQTQAGAGFPWAAGPDGAQPGPSGRRGAGFRLAGLGLIFVLALVLRLAASGSRGVDRQVWPDGLDYSAVADSFVGGQGLRYPVEGVRLPPPRPPGAPLALAPAALWRGPRGAWLGAALWGSLAVAATAAAARRVLPAPAALLAAGIALCAPSSVLSAGVPMSEACAQAFVAIALLAALRARSAPRAWPWAALGGAAVAWCVWIRLPLLAVLLPGLAAVAWPRPGGNGPVAQRARCLLLAVGLPFLGLAGLLAWQAAAYGSIGLNGYTLWAPELYRDNRDLVLSTRFLMQPAFGLWEQGHLREYGLGLAGLEAGSAGQHLWSWPVAALALYGAASLFRRRQAGRLVLAAAVLAALALTVFHLLYFWQDLRFFEPLLPLVALLAGCGAAQGFAVAARLLDSRPPRAAVACAWLALGTACLAAPAAALAERIGVARHEPSLCLDLDRAAAFCPADALLLINFPLLFARETFGPEREVWLLDLGSHDALLWRVVVLGLRDADGRAPAVRFLSGLSADQPPDLERLERAWRDGQPVCLLRFDRGAAAESTLAAVRATGARFEHLGRSGSIQCDLLLAPER